MYLKESYDNENQRAVCNKLNQYKYVYLIALPAR